MKAAKFEVGDKVKDLYEGGIREIKFVDYDEDDQNWVYSFDFAGWFWIPEEDLELAEEQ